MSESNLQKNARLWSTPTAIQPPTDHPDALAWLEPWIELEEHVETVGPDKKLVIFSAPRELRPLRVPPVVRWMSWPAARRSDLEHGPPPEIHHFELGEAADEVERAARELGNALRYYPYAIDAIDPMRDIDIPPKAWTWHRVKWGTRKTFVHLRWTAGDAEALDEAWGTLWQRVDSAIRVRDALVGWRPLYPGGIDEDDDVPT